MDDDDDLGLNSDWQERERWDREPEPMPDDSPSYESNLNDRCAGFEGDPVNVLGQASANACFGSSLGDRQLALGQAALSLVDALDQVATHSESTDPLTPNPTPFSLSNDIIKLVTGTEKPPSLSDTIKGFARDKVRDMGLTLFGGAVAMTFAPEVVGGLILLPNFGAFFYGTAVTAEVLEVAEWNKAVTTATDKAPARLAALRDINANVGRSVMDPPSGPIRLYGPGMSDMSISNSFQLK